MPSERSSRSTANAEATAGLTDEQVKQQQAEVKAGKASGKELSDAKKNAADTPHDAHASVATPGILGGIQMDSLTRRDSSDVFLGHFAVLTDDVKVSAPDPDKPGAVKDRTVEAGLYGVYEENVTVDSDGYPITVKFRGRDENNEVFVVPYASLAPTGGRGSAPR